MYAGKVVWVLDHRSSPYFDAQPLLSIRNIHLIMLEKNQLGIFELSALPPLVRQFGAPDLLIIGKDYADLQGALMIQFDHKPKIWSEHPSTLNADDLPSLPFRDATSLINCLQTFFDQTRPAPEPNLQLDPENCSIAYNGQLIRLTPREFDILKHLYIAPGHSVSRKDFFNHVWKGLKVCNKVLDVHVSNLRKKVHQHGISIQFVKPGSFEMSFVPEAAADTPRQGPVPIQTTGNAS